MNQPPPGGYGPPPGPGGYGPPPGGGYGPPPGGGYGAPPAPPGMGMQPMMGGQMQAPFGVDAMTGMPLSDKSKMTAGLLNLLLAGIGFGGIGRMYMGHVGIGVAQLLVGWLTCGVGLLWSIIDGIMIMTGKVPDPQGRPLKD